MWIVIIAVCIGNIAPGSATSEKRGLSKNNDIKYDVIRKVLTDGCDSDRVAVLGVAFEGQDFECGVTSNRQATSRQPEVTLPTAQNGSHLRDGTVQGHTLMGFSGPSPPSGTHRYILVVFETPRTAQLPVKARGHFSLKEFADVNEVSSIKGIFQFKVPAS
ncbi:uncharacterized protein LOC127849348 isoform X2 [Dreissena polymorpha]|uniref:uncharacterized protein LOC127849348 isoform X2 n=1 Tax=Dreissena polymorpha TaxID=45954 RepID=UPI0022642968|nr:uncharacterized protein LOC127849348 isoform X2 [Dreissena polymorpha]